jgi:hypothetical protein
MSCLSLWAKRGLLLQMIVVVSFETLNLFRHRLKKQACLARSALVSLNVGVYTFYVIFIFSAECRKEGECILSRLSFPLQAG